ncbi:MAG: hypothetical protein Q8M01_13965 [Rubrivivax sp.]|nr:hypothetical protein [Rubrivivax sp.]
MNLTAMLVAAFVVLSAASLSTWSWLVMAQVEDDLRSIGGFERIHFGA